MDKPKTGVTGKLASPLAARVPDGLKVVIATPTAEGTLESQHVASLVRLTRTLCEHSVGLRYVQVDYAEVGRARNILAAKFLSDEAATHILFLDNDVVFPSAAILKLLASGLPFVGAACPKRAIDLDDFYENAKTADSAKQAYARSLGFNITRLKNANPDNGLLEISAIGTGILLLDKSVFQVIADADLAQILPLDDAARKAGVTGNYRDFFGTVRNEAGEMLSEDLSFCDKFRRTPNAKLFALVDQEIGHVGRELFSGKPVSE